MYDEIKNKIEEILEITKKCPENLQEKCFELLVTPLLNTSKVQFSEHKSQTDELTAQQKVKSDFIVPIDVKAFMQQYSVPEERLKQLFLMQNNDVSPTHTLNTTKKARGQIQLAMLTALENALKGNKFQFSIASVKQKCIDHKTYDVANFQGILKKNESLFKSLTDQEAVELSPSGKSKLAEVILEITK